MYLDGFVNHSGGAVGADSAWDIYGRIYGVESRHYFAEGQKTPLGNVPISTDELTTADSLLIRVNETLHRRFPSGNDFVNNLIRRNYWQVINSEAVFAVASISDNIVDGGTGWAVHMAIELNKPVFVFDQKVDRWFTWAGGFVECDTPKLTKNFAGIGTRKLSDAGKDAIRDAYEKMRLVI